MTRGSVSGAPRDFKLANMADQLDADREAGSVVVVDVLMRHTVRADGATVPRLERVRRFANTALWHNRFSLVTLLPAALLKVE